jgi:SAM-dependent methyltransferase
MARKGKNTLNTILQDEGESCPVATDASSMECRPLPATNAELKEKYDEMHSQGPGAWFDDGAEEREAILKMGEPWGGKTVLEIGCGEGDLCKMITDRNSYVWGVDYSAEAISKARSKYQALEFFEGDYKRMKVNVDRIVMQGVLEHLDNPFEELKWMMDNLLVDGGDVITSSPMFVNPRGFVWMALNAVGAVMSKTDLHFLNPWDFEEFCKENGYGLKWTSCNHSWANGVRMIEDFRKRLPLALKDGGIFNPDTEEFRLTVFLDWLKKAGPMIDLGPNLGATAVYRITKEIH